MERLAPTELKRSNIQRPFIRFEQNKPSGREVVTVTGLSKSFDGSQVLKDVNLEIMRGDKVAIIGAERRRQDHAAPLPDRRAAAGLRHGQVGQRHDLGLLPAGLSRRDRAAA